MGPRHSTKNARLRENGGASFWFFFGREGGRREEERYTVEEIIHTVYIPCGRMLAFFRVTTYVVSSKLGYMLFTTHARATGKNSSARKPIGAEQQCEFRRADWRFAV